MNVLDIVEVIADREEYRKDGIVKGRRGRVFDVIIERPGWRKVYFINLIASSVSRLLSVDL